jgi:hypothetical protein
LSVSKKSLLYHVVRKESPLSPLYEKDVRLLQNEKKKFKAKRIDVRNSNRIRKTGSPRVGKIRPNIKTTGARKLTLD